MQELLNKDACRAKSRKGFTLLEILVVVAIIAILVSILLPAVHGMRQKARDREAAVNAQMLANAIRSFRTEYGYWPCNNPDAGGTYSSVADQVDIIDNYLLVTGIKNNHTPPVPFWETAGVVSNLPAKRPFIIKIDVAADTVSVY
jgi:prepilin-type N-terminal cleavage/methylation domain-containing protein